MGKETVEYFHFCRSEGWPDSDLNQTNNRLCSERRHWPFVLKENNFTTVQEFAMTTKNFRSEHGKIFGFIWKSLCVLTENYGLPFYVL